MQKTINIMTKTALAIIAAVLATGCIFEKMDMPKDLQNVLIQINVSADDMMTKGDPAESESAINTLHIYAFNGDALAGYYVSDDAAQEEYFMMDLALPASESIPVDFYVIANAASMKDHNNPIALSENMTRTELEALRFTGIVQNSSLPLYTKETKNLNTVIYKANTAENHNGHLLLDQQVSFTLSRSLAKLSVYGAKPAEASTSPEIISVEILAAGTREFSYLFPQTDDVLNAVASRANDRSIISARVQLADLSGDGKSAEHYTPVTTASTYVPEVAVGGTLDGWAEMTHERQLALKVEYVLNAGGQVKTGFIYMPRIERNMHYKVCILVKEEDEGNIYVRYEVADWKEHKMPGYTFTYPSHSYLRDDVPTSSGDTSEPSSAATMSETRPFEGYFQLLQPENEEWMPTLVGSYASDADIKVFDVETNDEVLSNTWPIKASSKWYRIEVKPHTDFVVGNAVDLAITYQPELMSASEYLLINGSAGNYYWPDSHDENFVTITMVN